MNTKSMRAALKTVYNSDRWKAKVDKMKDEQVVAVYRRLELQSKL